MEGGHTAAALHYTTAKAVCVPGERRKGKGREGHDEDEISAMGEKKNGGRYKRDVCTVRQADASLRYEMWVTVTNVKREENCVSGNRDS